MTTIARSPGRKDDLRSRAVARLQGPAAQAAADASAALGVLYELALSPATAPNALALLHELQVHQVEVDLQDEELRRSRLELETSLHRQVQLYDHAPVGFVTVDGNTVLREVNRAGARLLGCEPEFLPGRSLEGFMTPEGAALLRALLGRVSGGSPTEFADLQLCAAEGSETRRVHASACLDPAGGGFLIGLMEIMPT